MIRVFIGFDQHEAAAAYVLAHSIHERSSQPVEFCFINRKMLQEVYTRERSPLDSTDFSTSRFLVPYLCNYEGWALFVDCDMLCLDDIAKLWALRDERCSVQVVKHNYVPKETTKFLGAVQTKYNMKNWSSVMLFNCADCKDLSPEYVNTAHGLDLHQFKWAGAIGELPATWNHLVGVYEKSPDAAMVHYTLGGPYFTETKDCDYNEQWFSDRDTAFAVSQTSDLRTAKSNDAPCGR